MPLEPRALTAPAFLLLLTIGCATPLRYTSLDLGLLPCEMGASPVFFHAVEFDDAGERRYPSQVEALSDRLALRQAPGDDRSPAPVTDLIFFLHGWNKNPSSAEADYQDFLCRLHAYIRRTPGLDQQKREGGLVVVGIFWPSTITNRPRDPFLVKPVSYFRMRARADRIAETGLSTLLTDLIEQFVQSPSFPNRDRRLHLVGHSFGGRMLVQSLQALHGEQKLLPLFESVGVVDVVLLNAAISPQDFDWIADTLVRTELGRASRFSKDRYLFNVHSVKDTANRRLFRLASLFNDDPATCAAGACGVPRYPTVCADESGRIQPAAAVESSPDRLNVFNIDATPVIFGHTDIYKGRVASLVAQLLYDQEMKAGLPDIPIDEARPKPSCEGGE